MPHNSIRHAGRAVVAIVPISEKEFDTLDKLKELLREQDLPIGIVTKEAWLKLEKLYDLESING